MLLYVSKYSLCFLVSYLTFFNYTALFLVVFFVEGLAVNLFEGVEVLNPSLYLDVFVSLFNI